MRAVGIVLLIPWMAAAQAAYPPGPAENAALVRGVLLECDARALSSIIVHRPATSRPPANSRAGPAGLGSANRSRPPLIVFTSVTESRAERHKPPHMQVYHSAGL